MQLRLPIFPPECVLISSTVGTYTKDEMVHYIVNGLPVYSHHQDDLQAFRFIISNFISQKLCKQSEVRNTFQLSVDFVARAYKKFKDQGEEAFFGRDNRHGYCHKITGTRKEQIQKKLNKHQSVNSIAKEYHLTESAIRAAIKRGDLIRPEKKTILTNVNKALI